MLKSLDLSLSLPRDEYMVQLARRQIQLRELGWQVYLQKRPVVVVFEGWDAAGKGGAIRRITEKLDPRGYTVWPISAPEGEDKTRHYLYRFWRRLPPRGQIAIFDRSWYGRVLVERVEGFCTENEWRRAYKEINSFERQLKDEDWRNRAKWPAYEQAVEDMVLKTSTLTAPWHLIEGNDKYFARVKILSTLVRELSRDLDYEPADPLKRKK
jgi:polyphosphate kinase 2 (PPK2 family)